MTNPTNIFEDDIDIPQPPQKSGNEVPRLPVKKMDEMHDSGGGISGDEAMSAEMRRLAQEAGYAKASEGKKTVFDYTKEDHRGAKRVPKTFAGNPETIIKCFKKFCELHQKNDKQAFYEALRLLGSKYDFAPLAELPDWNEIRSR